MPISELPIGFGQFLGFELQCLFEPQALTCFHGRDEYAAEAGKHAVRKREAVREDGRVLIATVAIAIFKLTNPSGGRCDRVINHLGDIEPPVGVPRDLDGARDVGLGGHELDCERRVGQGKG